MSREKGAGGRGRGKKRSPVVVLSGLGGNTGEERSPTSVDGESTLEQELRDEQHSGLFD